MKIYCKTAWNVLGEVDLWVEERDEAPDIVLGGSLAPCHHLIRSLRHHMSLLSRGSIL